MKKILALFVVFFVLGCVQQQQDTEKNENQALDILIQQPNNVNLDKIDHPKFDIPEFKENQSEFNTEELQAAIRSGYKYPKNYQYKGDFDLIRNNLIYYIHSCNINDSLQCREICTDNVSIAYMWINNFKNYTLVKNITKHETEKYFEEYVLNDVSGDFLRVHKCSYLNTSNSTIDQINGVLGNINKRPLTNEVVEDFMDYSLIYREAYLSILSSFVVDKGDYFEGTQFYIHSGLLDRYQTIDLTKSVYKVDKMTGSVSVKMEIVSYNSKEWSAKSN